MSSVDVSTGDQLHILQYRVNQLILENEHPPLNHASLLGRIENLEKRFQVLWDYVYTGRKSKRKYANFKDAAVQTEMTMDQVNACVGDFKCKKDRERSHRVTLDLRNCLAEASQDPSLESPTASEQTKSCRGATGSTNADDDHMSQQCPGCDRHFQTDVDFLTHVAQCID